MTLVLDVRQFQAIWMLKRWRVEPVLGWLEKGTGLEFPEVAGIKPTHISEKLSITVERVVE